MLSCVSFCPPDSCAAYAGSEEYNSVAISREAATVASCSQPGFDNFVSRLVAKECDLQLTGEGPKTFQTLPRSEGVIYDTALAQVEITDTLGQTKVDALRLRVIDMPGVDLILGWPWLEGTNP